MGRQPVLADDLKWFGQSVVRLDAPLATLAHQMPQFARTEFTYGNALNEYLDLIVREPEPDDDRRVPVATVSKRYALIQHTDAIQWLCDAYAAQSWNPANVQATAWLSEYGERFRVRVTMPHAAVEIAPQDVIQADLVLWNSVDKSRAFELAIRWVRLICSNGLAIQGDDRLRKVHNADWMNRTSAVEFLRKRLPRSAKVIESLRSWLTVEILPSQIVAWVDGDVSQKWGKVRAARLLHILRTGRDAAVGRSSDVRKASELQVSQLQPVPGAPAPARDAYHIYQALTWIAGREGSIEQQEFLADEALRLMSPLLPDNLRRSSAGT